MARLSELGHSQVLPRINTISKQALQLVDAYVMARSQTHFELEPVSPGGAIADVANHLDAFAQSSGYRIVIDQTTPTGLVMANPAALKMMFLLLGSSIIEAGLDREALDHQLVFGIHRSAKGIVIGAFHSSLELTQDVYIFHGCYMVRQGRLLRPSVLPEVQVWL